jgi:Caspase domain
LRSLLKRTALIIGVDNYPDAQLDPLRGAERDARELRDRLNRIKSPFIYEGVECLTGKTANYRNIRQAISKVFRKTNDYDMILFYFSGHGLVDSKGNGYIATYDMGKDPYICGIDMQELRTTLFTSINREASILMLLDCCHSGIAVEGKKGGDNSGNAEIYRENFAKSLKKTVSSFKKGETEDSELLTRSAKGKLLMASSEGLVNSREELCSHRFCDTEDPQNHYHGLFTFALIEGLDGSAVDERGFVTFEALRKHIEKAMKGPDKHSPIFYSEGYRAIEDFTIAISPKKFSEQIDEVKNNINKCLNLENFFEVVRHIDDLRWRLQCDYDKLATYGINIDIINGKAKDYYWVVQKWVDQNHTFSVYVSKELWEKIKQIAEAEKDIEGLLKISRNKANPIILNILRDAYNNPRTKVIAKADREKIGYLVSRLQEAVKETDNRETRATQFKRRQRRSDTRFAQLPSKVPN